MNKCSSDLTQIIAGKNAYKKINEICTPYGKTIVAAGGEHALEAIKGSITAADVQAEISYITLPEKPAAPDTVAMLAENMPVKNAAMLFAVGGGQALDAVKAAGDMLSKPVFTFPTVAANGAACSGVALIHRENGTEKTQILSHAPICAFADTDIICNAPPLYLWAGLGEACANHAEAILSTGEKALADNIAHIATAEFEHTVCAIISSPCELHSTAYAVLNAYITVPEVIKNHRRGEVLALGMLISLLAEKDTDEFAKIYEFNKSVNLPVSPADLGVSEDDEVKLISTVENFAEKYGLPVTKDALIYAFEKLSSYNNVCRIN